MVETRAGYSLTWQCLVFICSCRVGMLIPDVMVRSTFLPFLTSAFVRLLLGAGKALESLKELCFGAWNGEACPWLWGKHFLEEKDRSGRPVLSLAECHLAVGRLGRVWSPASVSSSHNHKEGLGPILNACHLSLVNVTSPNLHSG